jgi:hypothetical protein
MQKYNPQYWFDDMPVLAKLPPSKIATKLRELGDIEAAETIRNQIKKKPRSFAFSASFWPSRQTPAWQHTAHAFGYIPPVEAGTDESVKIAHAGNMKADMSLKNARIKITLGALRVAGYPGKGIHHILFDFYAQNQLKNHVEHLHFNQVYRAREKEAAAIIGYPIFIGLNVGSEGVAFKGYTVNVKNETDEAILDFLDRDIFRAGLKLATTAQPAIAPLAGIAIGLTKMVASRHKNVAVQDFFMGLDFTNVPFSAKLAQGSYIAVQIPEEQRLIWDWKQWIYDPTNGRIVNKDDANALIPYNYVVFSVSRYEDTE